MPHPALSLEGIGVRFTTDHGVVPALEGIDLTLEEGRFLTVLGPSGCGKSTLLRIVADLIPPTAGKIEVMGEHPSAARRRREIGFVFQDPALLPWRTVIDNVRLPLEVGGGMRKQPKRTPEQLIALVGLSGWEDALPHQLSGGMRQRVSIARALVNDPKLLLMDEPFGALDEITRDRMNEELLSVWAETKTTIVFVTHSIYEAAYLSQSILLLAARPGRIREIVPVDFDYPRGVATRDSPEFTALLSRLRHVLGNC